MRYIFEDKEENYELKDKLQKILDKKEIKFTYDDSFRLCVPNSKQNEVENILNDIGLKFEIYQSDDSSVERYYLYIYNHSILTNLEKELYEIGIEYDYDDGGRILVPTIDAARSELIFEKLGIKYDLL